MRIVCPACGQETRDPAFCEHCNGKQRAPAPVPGHCPIAGGVELTSDQQAALSRPEAALVLNVDGSWQRVHWIDRETWPLWSARLRERLAKNSLKCLPPARLVEEAAGAWVIVETSNDAFQPWTCTLADPQEECERLVYFFALLASAVEELHSHGLVWLTFNPEQIEPVGPEQLRFTNLDLGVYPTGQCPERLQLRTSFAAPEILRYHPEDIGPRADVFHLGAFAYYWLAGLLPYGFAGEGLEAIWYQLPKLRVFAPRLPPGIAGVLARAMALEPARRQATPAALVADLKDAVARNRRRLRFQLPVSWDIGADTRTGRTKTALGKDNEDRVLVRTFAEPQRALVAVADGISTCAVGSGALASLIVTIVLENVFDAASARDNFADRIASASQHGAHTLLNWAVEKGYRQQLEEGADLMGTTLTAGWLEGNVLSLANLGDSRAYLIADSIVEQLTVDGDLASGMLAEGMPPETVREFGPVGKALRECVGGCTLDAAGELSILENCSAPPVTHWHLLPGDVVVLCSDGLVEEGAFLEPEMLADLVRGQRHLPAQELARLLTQAADDLHRLPSPLEPEGFGDNISCIVVKIDGDDVSAPRVPEESVPR